MTDNTSHGLPMTAIFRRNEQGSGFTGIIAELPGPYAQGETLAETRENLKRQLASFLAFNRKLALRDIRDTGIVEILVLQLMPDKEEAAESDPGALRVCELVRIPLPIRIQFGPEGETLVRDLVETSVITSVTFDVAKVAALMHSLKVENDRPT